MVTARVVMLGLWVSTGAIGLGRLQWRINCNIKRNN